MVTLNKLQERIKNAPHFSDLIFLTPLTSDGIELVKKIHSGL